MRFCARHRIFIVVAGIVTACTPVVVGEGASDGGGGTVDASVDPLDATTAPGDGATADVASEVGDAALDARADGTADGAPHDGGYDGGPHDAAATHVPPPFGHTIAAGYYNTCAVHGGEVYCWGYDQWGALGNGPLVLNQKVPGKVVGITNASQVSVRVAGGCVLKDDGTVMCWGSGDSGFGTGVVVADSHVPVAIPSLVDVIQIDGTCALRADHTLFCWGDTKDGRIGAGHTSGVEPVTAVLTKVVQVAVGTNNTCALLEDTTVKCWGSNVYGQLGPGNYGIHATPVFVPGLTGVASISAGAEYVCAVMADTTVRCWGANGAGQLGAGTTSLGRETSLPAVTSLTNVAMVAAGRYQRGALIATTCALSLLGKVSCWGANDYGGIGDGTTTDRLSPKVIPSLSNVREIASGGGQSCAVLTDDSVWCWGSNDYYQVGAGSLSTENSLVPVQVLP